MVHWRSRDVSFIECATGKDGISRVMSPKTFFFDTIGHRVCLRGYEFPFYISLQSDNGRFFRLQDLSRLTPGVFWVWLVGRRIRLPLVCTITCIVLLQLAG